MHKKDLNEIISFLVIECVRHSWFELVFQAMYEAVMCGDIDLLDDLMDIPGADINMEWVSLEGI